MDQLIHTGHFSVLLRSNGSHKCLFTTCSIQCVSADLTSVPHVTALDRRTATFVCKPGHIAPALPGVSELAVVTYLRVIVALHSPKVEAMA